jgi:hypothetical protein
MHKGENLDAGNPMLECPDDSVCHQCGKPLPEITNENPPSDEQYFAFEGFCGPGCAAYAQAAIKSHSYTDEFMRRIAKYAKLGELAHARKS